MASKSSMYAMYEAVQHEMRQRKDMTWLFELTPAVASNPGLAVINLEKEFGRTRVNNTAATAVLRIRFRIIDSFSRLVIGLRDMSRSRPREDQSHHEDP